MKILFISPRYSGGIGGHAARLAEKLNEFGFEVKLMHTPHVPLKKLKNPSFTILSSLKTLFGKDAYDVVHAFNVPSAFAMRYAKAKKKVLSVHGMFSDQVKGLHSTTTSAIADFTESRVLKWADKLTTDSKMIQKAISLSKRNPKKFEFQMLKGIRDEIKDDLTKKKFVISDYIPYGTNWLAYSFRRIKERKRNILLLGSSFFQSHRV